MHHFFPLPCLAGWNTNINRNRFRILVNKFSSDMFFLQGISSTAMCWRSVDSLSWIMRHQFQWEEINSPYYSGATFLHIMLKSKVIYNLLMPLFGICGI